MCNEKLPLLWKMSKSNHRRCFTKKVSLKISQNSQENTCARVSFSIKLLKRLSLKKRTWHRCFPVKFAKYLRTPFLQNTSKWNDLVRLFINFADVFKILEYLQNCKKIPQFFIFFIYLFFWTWLDNLMINLIKTYFFSFFFSTDIQVFSFLFKMM